MVDVQNSLRSIEVLTVAVDSASVLALTDDERYTYYMLRHIFNELMCLQKLLSFTFLEQDDNRPIRLEPEMAQTLFIFRIAGGKIWEAKLAFDEGRMSAVLRGIFLPLTEDGANRWKNLNKKIQTVNWLKNLRNWHAFHYPNINEWNSVIQKSEKWTDDEIFISAESGNTFYAGSEKTALIAMFGILNSAEPSATVDPMIKDLLTILAEFNSLIEDILYKFISKKLVFKKTGSDKVSAPEFSSIKIPFWTYMPKKQA